MYAFAVRIHFFVIVFDPSYISTKKDSRGIGI